jgi:hypothetical protein
MAGRIVDPRRIEVVDPEVARILRTKSIPQRVAMILQANQTMRQLIAAPIRNAHPEFSESQVRREVARRICGTG